MKVFESLWAKHGTSWDKESPTREALQNLVLPVCVRVWDADFKELDINLRPMETSPRALGIYYSFGHSRIDLHPKPSFPAVAVVGLLCHELSHAVEHRRGYRWKGDHGRGFRKIIRELAEVRPEWVLPIDLYRCWGYSALSAYVEGVDRETWEASVMATEHPDSWPVLGVYLK
jgi:hypothetical protein